MKDIHVQGNSNQHIVYHHHQAQKQQLAMAPLLRR